MGIRSEAPQGERSETNCRVQVDSKRRGSNLLSLDHEIVRSSRKREAVWRALQNYKVDEETGCWVWKGGKSHGYGQVRIHSIFGSRPLYAHRLSYLLSRGQSPDGKEICHTCDNPACINPHHLFIGTQSDNMKDMANKMRSCIGDKNAQSKLTNAQVAEIRDLVGSGVRQYRVAEMYDVSQAQVSRIVRGRERRYDEGETRHTHGNLKHGRYSARLNGNDIE